MKASFELNEGEVTVEIKPSDGGEPVELTGSVESVEKIIQDLKDEAPAIKKLLRKLRSIQQG